MHSYLIDTRNSTGQEDSSISLVEAWSSRPLESGQPRSTPLNSNTSSTFPKRVQEIFIIKPEWRMSMCCHILITTLPAWLAFSVRWVLLSSQPSKLKDIHHTTKTRHRMSVDSKLRMNTKVSKRHSWTKWKLSLSRSSIWLMHFRLSVSKLIRSSIMS